MAAAHLEKLNDRQREAVEHGIGLADGSIGGPLLIIAGAGSGKTNTLAHRVAHLIVNGADPRRILLMTFSRRAASEMARRVQRICRQVLGDSAAVMTDALAWAGFDCDGVLLQSSRLSPLPGDVSRLAATNPVFLLWGVRTPPVDEGVAQ